MRRSRTAGILTAMPAELPGDSRSRSGTRLGESACPAAGGGVGELRPQRRLRQSQPRILPGHGAGQNDGALGFTLAAYNLDRVRSNKGQAWPGRRWTGRRQAQAMPGSPTLGRVVRDRRKQPDSPTDVAPPPSRATSRPRTRAGFSASKNHSEQLDRRSDGWITAPDEN